LKNKIRSQGRLLDNTSVLTLDGTNPTLKELTTSWKKDKKPFWVFGRTGAGILIPTLAINPRVVVESNKMCIITYDNGGKSRCTPNLKFVINNPDKKDLRLIWYRGLPYIKARDLKPGDSINSMYLRATDSTGGLRKKKADLKYLSIIEELSCTERITSVQRFVLQRLKPETFKRYQKANRSGDRKKQIDIHHKDKNETNNDPSNLHILLHYTHFRLHGREFLKKYNGSPEQRKMLQHYWRKGNPKADAHRKILAFTGKRPKVIFARCLGRYASQILGLLKLGAKINPETWDFYAPVNAYISVPSWNTEMVLGSISYIRRKGYSLDKGWDLVPKTERPKQQKITHPIQVITMFVKMSQRTLAETGKLNEKIYTLCKKRTHILGGISPTTPKWKTGLKGAGLENKSLKEIKVFVENYSKNHKVTLIKTITLKRSKKFYSLEVPKTGNFMVNDGKGNGVLINTF
jgi:hypothetical protein